MHKDVRFQILLRSECMAALIALEVHPVTVSSFMARQVNLLDESLAAE